MQKLHPREVNVPTYYFGVHKTLGILSTRVIFRVQHRQIHGVTPFHYCASLLDLSNGLLSNLNEDHMQKFFLGEVDLPTYLFVFNTTIGV